MSKSDAFFDNFNKSFTSNFEAIRERDRETEAFKEKTKWQSEFDAKQAEIGAYKKTRAAMSTNIKSMSRMLNISNQQAARILKGKSVAEIENDMASIKKMYDSNNPNLAPLTKKYFNDLPASPADATPAPSWDTDQQIGRASCRDRGKLTTVARSSKDKTEAG